MGSGGDRNLPFIFTGQVLHQQPQCLHELHLLRTRTILRQKKMGASVCPLASWSASLLLQPPHLLILTGLLVSYWETEPSHAAASSTEKRWSRTALRGQEAIVRSCSRGSFDQMEEFLFLFYF